MDMDGLDSRSQEDVVDVHMQRSLGSSSPGQESTQRVEKDQVHR